jgi:hypothetical protein
LVWSFFCQASNLSSVQKLSEELTKLRDPLNYLGRVIPYLAFEGKTSRNAQSSDFLALSVTQEISKEALAKSLKLWFYTYEMTQEVFSRGAGEQTFMLNAFCSKNQVSSLCSNAGLLHPFFMNSLRDYFQKVGPSSLKYQELVSFRNSRTELLGQKTLEFNSRISDLNQTCREVSKGYQELNNIPTSEYPSKAGNILDTGSCVFVAEDNYTPRDVKNLMLKQYGNANLATVSAVIKDVWEHPLGKLYLHEQVQAKMGDFSSINCLQNGVGLNTVNYKDIAQIFFSDSSLNSLGEYIKDLQYKVLKLNVPGAIEVSRIHDILDDFLEISPEIVIETIRSLNSSDGHTFIERNFGPILIKNTQNKRRLALVKKAGVAAGVIGGIGLLIFPGTQGPGAGLVHTAFAVSYYSSVAMFGGLYIGDYVSGLKAKSLSFRLGDGGVIETSRAIELLNNANNQVSSSLSGLGFTLLEAVIPFSSKIVKTTKNALAGMRVSLTNGVLNSNKLAIGFQNIERAIIENYLDFERFAVLSAKEKKILLNFFSYQSHNPKIVAQNIADILGSLSVRHRNLIIKELNQLMKNSKNTELVYELRHARMIEHQYFQKILDPFKTYSSTTDAFLLKIQTLKNTFVNNNKVQVLLKYLNKNFQRTADQIKNLYLMPRLNKKIFEMLYRMNMNSPKVVYKLQEYLNYLLINKKISLQELNRYLVKFNAHENGQFNFFIFNSPRYEIVEVGGKATRKITGFTPEVVATIDRVQERMMMLNSIDLGLPRHIADYLLPRFSSAYLGFEHLNVLAKTIPWSKVKTIDQARKLNDYVRFHSKYAPYKKLEALKASREIIDGTRSSKYITEFFEHKSKVKNYENELFKKMSLRPQGQTSQSILEVAQSRARLFDEMVMGCRAKNMSSYMLYAKSSFTNFQVGMGVGFAVTGYMMQNSDKTKNAQWFTRLGYDIISTYISRKIASGLQTNSNSDFTDKFLSYYKFTAFFDAIAAPLQSVVVDGAIKIDEGSFDKSQVDSFLSNPEWKAEIIKLLKFLETDPEFNARLDDLKSKIASVNSSSELKDIFFKDESSTEENFFHALEKLQYEESVEGNWISTGSASGDRYLAHRLYDFFGVSSANITASLIYNTLCFGSVSPATSLAAAITMYSAITLSKTNFYYWYYGKMAPIQE